MSLLCKMGKHRIIRKSGKVGDKIIKTKACNRPGCQWSKTK